MGQKYATEVTTRVGVPILIEGLLDRTPSKVSEMAIEEDMVCILVRTTHHTIAIGRPVPLSYVVRGRESVAEQFPKEDFNFEGDGHLLCPVPGPPPTCCIGTSPRISGSS